MNLIQKIETDKTGSHFSISIECFDTNNGETKSVMYFYEHDAEKEFYQFYNSMMNIYRDQMKQRDFYV